MYVVKNTFSKIVKITFLLMIATTGWDAFASDPLGNQATKYTVETFLGNEHIPDPLMARGTLGEARNAFGTIMQVWRGATNNQVWMAVDGGTAFSLGSTDTLVAPTVVPYGLSNFAVFYVGTDDHINYALVNPLTENWLSSSSQGWIQVPNQTTFLPVSVTQFGPGPTNLYMVYLSSSGDGRIYGTWLDNTDNNWHQGGNIAGAQALSQPSITYDVNDQRLWVAAEGLDGNIITTSNALGSPDWSEIGDEGVVSHGPVTIGSAPVNDPPDEGQMILAYRDANRTAQFVVVEEDEDHLLDAVGNAADNTGWQTNDAVGLSVTNDSVYDRFTGLNNTVYWKFVAFLQKR